MDQQLFWKINKEWTNPFLDWFMPALSAIEAWMPLLILVVIVLAWRGGRRERFLLTCLVIAIGLGDGVVGRTLKKTFDRVRPRDHMSGVIIRDVAKIKPRTLALFHPPEIKVSKVKKPGTGGNSLPSNHTINLFAVAAVFLSLYRSWGIGVLLLACGVAWSRIYVGAHWPSDIPPSIGLGLCCGWLGVAISTWLWRSIPALRQSGG
jgi:undecaprenyl-diphosphatase